MIPTATMRTLIKTQTGLLLNKEYERPRPEKPIIRERK